MFSAWVACALLAHLGGAAAAALYVQNNCDADANVAVTFSSADTAKCYSYFQADPTIEAVCINAWYSAPGGGATTLLLDGLDNGCLFLTAHKIDNELYVWPVTPTCQAPGLCQHDLNFLPCVGDITSSCYYWFQAPGDGGCVPTGEDYTWKITCETGVVPLPSPSPSPTPAYATPADAGKAPSTPSASPSPQPLATDGGGGSSLSIGAIVGIAVGGVAALVLALAALLYCRRRRRRKAASPEEPPLNPAGPMAAGPLAYGAADGPPTKPPLDPFDSAYSSSTLPPAPSSYGSAATQGSLATSQAPSAPVATALASASPAASAASGLSLPSQPSSGADPLHLIGAAPAAWPSGALPSRGPLASWELRWEDLKLERSIGAGSYGHVYKGTYHETPVAIKVLLEPGGEGGAGSAAPEPSSAAAVTSAAAHSQLMSPSSPLMARLEQEAAIMSLMSHPAIIQFLGLTTAPVAAIVTEFASRGSLHAVLQAAVADPRKAADLTWPRRIAMACDCCRGMLYLHSRSPPIVHRDLKSPNVLIGTHWGAKISDFNLSKLVDDELASHSASATATAMNPRWLAPEVLRGERATKAADVYAFGVILWELMTWQLPWTGVNPWSIVAAVAAGRRPPLPPRDRLPGGGAWAGLDGYVALMERCWAARPEDRPAFEEVMAALKGIDPAAAAADE